MIELDMTNPVDQEAPGPWLVPVQALEECFCHWYREAYMARFAGQGAAGLSNEALDRTIKHIRKEPEDASCRPAIGTQEVCSLWQFSRAIYHAQRGETFHAVELYTQAIISLYAWG